MVIPELVFHHVGIGTADFDGAIQTCVSLGHRLHSRTDDPGINVRVAFLSCPGGRGPWIEILAPLGPDGPLQSLIRRKLLPSPYHCCYAVDRLEKGDELLRTHRFAPIGVPQPALAFGGARIAFYYHAALGLVELVESPPDWPIPAA